MPTDWPGIGTAIGGIASLYNIASQGAQNRKNREFSYGMYRQQRSDALADRDFENEYNSPSAQMARLKKAGLNPALVYGGGAGSMSGSSTRSSDMKQPDTRAPQADTGFISQFVELMKMDKQIDLLKAQTDAEKENVNLRRVGVAKSEFDLSQSRLLAPGQLTALELSNRKLQADTQFTLDENDRKTIMQATNLQEAAARIARMAKENARTDIEIAHINKQIAAIEQDMRLKAFDEGLQAAGIHRNSPSWFRVVGGVVNSIKSGFSNPGDIVEEEMKKLGYRWDGKSWVK